MTSNMPGGPPGDKRDGRPIPRNGRPNAHQTTSTTNSVQATTDTIAEIGRRVAADVASAKFWYRLGLSAGIEHGRQDLAAEVLAEEERLGKHISGIRRLPDFAELEARRWGGPRSRFGEPRPGDHQGGPVDWETSRPSRSQGAA